MLTTLGNSAPVAASASSAVLMPGQKVPVASLFDAIDPEGDPFFNFAFMDAGNQPNGGYLLFNGQPQNSNQLIGVDAHNIGLVEYVAGSVPGVETLYVSASSDLSPTVTGMGERAAVRVTTAGIMLDGGGDSIEDARAVTLGSTAVAINEYLGRNDFMQTLDTHDYFRLTVDRPGTLLLDLTGLEIDADLELLGADGGVIAESSRLGNTSEHVSAFVGAGSYYAHVVAITGDSSYYDLTAVLA
jgi:hypothetical protein